MTDLPFQAEYAKSGRAACKGCKQKIDQGALRIAIMVQSAFFDGKQPNWHHEDCFFKKQHPNSASDIGNFNKLKSVDQKRIKSIMENSTGIVMPVEKPKGKGKSKKRAADDTTSDAIAESTNIALKDYLVEYSKSSRATCKHCDIKICKDEVRISKTVYDTEIGSKYGGQPLWHHVKCFAERRSEFNFFAGGETLPGFNTLKKEDKAMVKEEIKPFKADEVPVKKLKVEPKNEEELKAEKDKENKLVKQNKLFFKYRSALSQLSKPDLEELLEVNSQEITPGKDERLDHLADCMAFGVPEPCTVCKQGQLVLDTFGYKCTGNLTEWTKCSHVTQNPKRSPMIIPDAFKDGSVFKRYKPKTDVRLFESERVPLLVVVKNETTNTVKKEMPVPPLKNLQFFLYGKLKNKEETKKRILKLGGLVVSKLTATTVAVVSTKKDVERMPDKMEEIKSMDIEVVEESFLDLIEQDGTISKSLELIKENNIADWGSDPATRVPQDVLDGKSIPKSGSLYVKSSKSAVKLKIQGIIEDRKSTAVRQVDVLIAFMEAHADFATGKLRSKERQALTTRLWDQCADLINSEGVGETPKDWSKVWNLYKRRVRAKLAKINRGYRGTGGGPRMAPQLSPQEARVAALIERDVGPLTGVRQDPEIEIQYDNAEEIAVEQDAEPPVANSPILNISITHQGTATSPATQHLSRTLSLESEQKDSALSVGRNQTADQGTTAPQTGGTAVDPASQLQDEAHVYTDYDGTKYTVVLSQTDVVAQKNSYYKLQVLESDGKKRYWLFRSWGRIGTTIGGSKVETCKSREEAVTKFEDMYMEKTENVWEHRDHFMKVPGRYFPLDMDYGSEDAGPQNLAVDSKCDLPIPVQNLVIKIFDVDVMKKTLLEFELDTEKMPLGKLSKKQIKSGYKILSELLKLIEKGSTSQSKLIDATNRFFTLIPHDFGVKNAPLLDNVELIKTKTAMLDNLLEIEIAYSLMKTDSNEDNPISSHYLKLKASIDPLPTSSPEFEMIQEYVRNTHAATHSTFTLDIEQVFKVVREGEDKRFKPFRKLHNRRLLWHGSRITNFAGIISQGLRIAPPEAPVTGYMFGKGVYFADMVSKSANYCCTHTRNPIGLMLLCEVALGNMKECHHAENVQLPPNMHSAWGVGKTMPDPAQNRTLDDGTIVPLGKPVTSKVDTHLLYNEFIVYDVAQVNVKYLLQMKFNHKY